MIGLFLFVVSVVAIAVTGGTSIVTAASYASPLFTAI